MSPPNEKRHPCERVALSTHRLDGPTTKVQQAPVVTVLAVCDQCAETHVYPRLRRTGSTEPGFTENPWITEPVHLFAAEDLDGACIGIPPRLVVAVHIGTDVAPTLWEAP